MPKRDAIRELALEVSYFATTSERLPQLWSALKRADPALAAEIMQAWKQCKPCFYEWMIGRLDAEIDASACECRGACDEIGAAA
jgi:hypothetical protein